MKGKAGRPKKDPADARSEIVLVRMTTAERADCENAAEQVGVRLSEWIRERLAKAAKRESKKG